MSKTEREFCEELRTLTRDIKKATKRVEKSFEALMREQEAAS